MKRGWSNGSAASVLANRPDCCGNCFSPGLSVDENLVIGLIMAVHAVIDSAERGHLLGDVPALILVAIVLGFLAPRDVVPVARLEK
jgi:hypothetical protein